MVPYRSSLNNILLLPVKVRVVMFTKLLYIGTVGLFSVLGFNISGSDTQPSMLSSPAQAAPTEDTIEIIPAVVETSFHRGFTNLQAQPCRNDHTREYYESDLISKDETAHVLISIGATTEQADILSAIARAESANQNNCFGDDSSEYYGKPTNNGKHWGPSYGNFQIRTILEESNTGTCRDIERLRLNLVEQSKCAMELSNGGTKFSPTWSTHTNGKYKKWLGKTW